MQSGISRWEMDVRLVGCWRGTITHDKTITLPFERHQGSQVTDDRKRVATE